MWLKLNMFSVFNRWRTVTWIYARNLFSFSIIIDHLHTVNKVINKILLFRSSMPFINKYNLYTHLYIYTKRNKNEQAN